MQKLKIFCDLTHYSPEQRYYLKDTLKALWNDRSIEERIRLSGNWIEDYEVTTCIEDADVAFLTMKWNYYVDQNLLNWAEEEITNAKKNRKFIVIFCYGDPPSNLTSLRFTYPGIILFELGGYRSNADFSYHSGSPFFLKDYLQIYCGGHFLYREKIEIPTVGFCGQADSPVSLRLIRGARHRFRNFMFKAGISKWAAPPFETTGFRRYVLRKFENHSSIKTNFILHQKYHAGNEKDKGDFSQQKIDFINNILDSDYTICVRGGGNFSVRFYETLSLGRIPVFIDTDCLLPFEDIIPYPEIFPIIKMADLPRVADILTDFHQNLSDQEYKNLQMACRKLWMEHFTPNGFYSDLRVKLSQLIDSKPKK